MLKNQKNPWKSMKIANIDRENFHIFWTTWGNSIKFSGKMWLILILKVTKKQGFTLSLEDTLLEKPQAGGSNWPPSLFKIKLLTIWLLRISSVRKLELLLNEWKVCNKIYFCHRFVFFCLIPLISSVWYVHLFEHHSWFIFPIIAG